MGTSLVKSIHLVNFLTYSDCSIDLNKGLNIIYGPNGSGKSSIVCAICLILGDDHKILHRAGKIYEYVKIGETEAKIELIIVTGNKENRITRIISRLKMKTYWSLNNRSSDQKAIKQLVTELKINVNNICNFLPQDRVSDFFKMNPQELLLALEETIQDGELKKQHDQLICLRNDIFERQNILNAKEKEMQRLDNQYKWAQEDYRKYEEWFENQNILKITEQKIAWIKYQMSLNEYKAKCKVFDVLKKSHDDIQKDALLKNSYGIEDINCSRAKYYENNTRMSNTIKQKCLELQNLADINTKSLKTINPLKQQILNIKIDVKIAMENISVRKKQIEITKSEIQSLKDDLESQLPLKKEAENAIEILKCKIEQLETMKHKESTKLIDIHLSLQNFSTQLREIMSVEERMLKELQKRDPNAYKVYQILNENRIEFKSKVYSPLFLHINVLKPSDVVYFENHISKRDMFAFLVNNRDDMHLFIHEFREKRGLKVSCLLVNAESQQTSNSVKISTFSSDFDFKNHLVDLFEAPPLVVAFLIQSYNVDAIPIFRNLSESNYNQLTNTPSLRCFFTATEKYNIKVSQYSQNPVVSSFTLKTSQSLFKSVNSNQVKKLEESINWLKQEEQQIMTAVCGLTRNIQDAKNEISTHAIQLKGWNDVKKLIKSNEDKIENKNNEILMCEENLVIFQTKLRISCGTLSKTCGDFIPSFTEISTLIQNCLTVVTECCLLRLEELRINSNEEVVRVVLEGVREMSESILTQMEAVRMEKASKKQEGKELLALAMQICGMKSSQKSISCEIKEKFSQISDDFEVLTQSASDLRALVDTSAIMFSENAVEKFNDILSKVTDIKGQVDEHTTSLNSFLENEATMKESYLRLLNDSLFEISASFSEFFQKLKCQGRIELVQDPTGDYSKYSLGIMVSYREDEAPIRLSNTRHSGGEKAVATMLFLMSIQQLSTSPFKVVDEINQGMDCLNEKTVFQIMVETISKLSASTQYLFLSPKVLPNLTYDDNMTVHVICSGPLISNTDAVVLN